MREQVSVPDTARAKDLVLKILAIAGGELEAKARLNKAFYAAHVIYWRTREGILSNYPVVKLPNGPCIDEVDRLLDELEQDGKVEVILGTKGPYPQTTIRLLQPVVVDPTSAEYEPLQRAVRWVKNHTVAELSRLTHDRPSYDAQPRIGYEQAIYLDSITDDQWDEVRTECSKAHDLFKAALGDDA